MKIEMGIGWVPDEQKPGGLRSATPGEYATEIEKLRLALLDCATDLQASVTAEYHGVLDYPVMRRKFERDMEPVDRARALLGDIMEQPKKPLRA